MQITLSFGISVIMGLVYLILYRSLTPLIDLILFVGIAFFIGFSYIKATNNHYIKISLLLLITCIILIPTVILSTENNFIHKVVWSVITIILLQKEIRKEIHAINEH